MAIPRSPRLPCLTGARFGAALLVVLFHFGKLPGLPEIFFLFGRQAVSFFFILSGLVLTYSYRDALRAGAIGWTGFMNLRCARILPLHVTTWLMATVLYGWYRWYPDQGSHPLATWLMGLFCVQVYWPSVDNAYKWNGPAWSIACELFFYALFPLLLPPLTRRLTSVAAISTAMVGVFLVQVGVYVGTSAILAQRIYAGHFLLGYTTHIAMTMTVLVVFPPLRVGEFVLGMCLGLFMLHRGPVLQSRTAANALLGGCLCAIMTLAWLPWDQWNPIITGTREYLAFVPLFALTILVLASGLTVMTPLLESRVAVMLGEASYALYLIHGFSVGVGLPGSQPTIVRYILSVGACVIASMVVYVWLECPARKLWRKATTKRGLWVSQ